MRKQKIGPFPLKAISGRYSSVTLFIYILVRLCTRELPLIYLTITKRPPPHNNETNPLPEAPARQKLVERVLKKQLPVEIANYLATVNSKQWVWKTLILRIWRLKVKSEEGWKSSLGIWWSFFALSTMSFFPVKVVFGWTYYQC